VSYIEHVHVAKAVAQQGGDNRLATSETSDEETCRQAQRGSERRRLLPKI
jgi:hypothetical protein